MHQQQRCVLTCQTRYDALPGEGEPVDPARLCALTQRAHGRLLFGQAAAGPSTARLIVRFRLPPRAARAQEASQVRENRTVRVHSVLCVTCTVMYCVPYSRNLALGVISGLVGGQGVSHSRRTETIAGTMAAGATTRAMTIALPGSARGGHGLPRCVCVRDMRVTHCMR